jgi:hypothetical protein
MNACDSPELQVQIDVTIRPSSLIDSKRARNGEQAGRKIGPRQMARSFGESSLRANAPKITIGAIYQLRNFIQQPVERDIKLVRRFIGAGGNLIADLVDQ